MDRVEIIRLRLSGSEPQDLIEDIRRSIQSEPDLTSARIYRHATVSTDFSIHLRGRNGETNKKACELGTRLAAALRDFGMVEHSVWIEERPSFRASSAINTTSRTGPSKN